LKSPGFSKCSCKSNLYRYNVGLLALKRCIDALHEGQRLKKEGKPPPHVPYQDSKLTMLLSSALVGPYKSNAVQPIA
jgi:hypothetical protein